MPGIEVCHDARMNVDTIVLPYARMRTTNEAWYEVTVARLQIGSIPLFSQSAFIEHHVDVASSSALK